jgi:hypothetical protein
VEGDEGSRTMYRSDYIGKATRLIDVLRSTIGSKQITVGSKEISDMVQKLCRFQATILCSTDDLLATILIRHERTHLQSFGVQHKTSAGSTLSLYLLHAHHLHKHNQAGREGEARHSNSGQELDDEYVLDNYMYVCYPFPSTPVLF